MAASFRVEPYMYDVLLLSYDRSLATGDADEEAIRRNEDFARALAEYLETECKLRVFFYCRDMIPGEIVFHTLFGALEKSKFIVPVMCPAFMQDCWGEFITDIAFLDRLGSALFIPVCVLGVTQQVTKGKMKKYRAINCLYFQAHAVLPEDDPVALDKLRRALTADVSQSEKDDRNNEGQGDLSNGEPLEEPGLPYLYWLTDDQPPPLLQRQSGLVECRQESDFEGMETLESWQGTWQTGDEGSHFIDETVEGQPQPGPSSLGYNALPSQDSPPPPPPPPPLLALNGTGLDSVDAPPAPLIQKFSEKFADAPEDRDPPLPPVNWYSPVSSMPETQTEVFEGLNRVGTGSDSAAKRPSPLGQNWSEGFLDAPEEGGSSSPPAACYSPVSPMPQTQAEVFQGPNREERDFEAMVEETAEGGQDQDAVRDGSGENSVRSWMGSLPSFLRDVAPVFWTCILYIVYRELDTTAVPSQKQC